MIVEVTGFTYKRLLMRSGAKRVGNFWPIRQVWVKNVFCWFSILWNNVSSAFKNTSVTVADCPWLVQTSLMSSHGSLIQIIDSVNQLLQVWIPVSQPHKSLVVPKTASSQNCSCATRQYWFTESHIQDLTQPVCKSLTKQTRPCQVYVHWTSNVTSRMLREIMNRCEKK